MDHVIDDLLPCPVAFLEPERRLTTSLDEDLHTRCQPFEDLFALLFRLVLHPCLEVVIIHLFAVRKFESAQDVCVCDAELDSVDILQDGLGRVDWVKGRSRPRSSPSLSKGGDSCFVEVVGVKRLTE